MERRKAITTAAAASLTLLAGAGGIALNSGIVSARGDDAVGQLSPVATQGEPVIVYVDTPTASVLSTSPRVQPSTGEAVETSAASAYGDDDRYDEDGDSSDTGDEYDDGYEYEGAEDDD